MLYYIPSPDCDIATHFKRFTLCRILSSQFTFFVGGFINHIESDVAILAHQVTRERYACVKTLTDPIGFTSTMLGKMHNSDSR